MTREHDLRVRQGVVAVALVGCLAVVGGCQDPWQSKLDRAGDLAFQGRYEEAVYVLDELLTSLPDVPNEDADPVRLKALSKAGRIAHLFLRNVDLAVSYHSRIIELYPGSEQSYEARQKLARIHVEANDRARAVVQYQALVSGFPDKPGVDQFQYELARGYFVLGDHEQSRTEARRLLELWPDSHYADRVRMLVATTYHIQGRHEKAVQAYEEARDATEDVNLAAHALFETAGSLAAMGKKEKAVETYLEALATHPRPQIVRMRLDRLRGRMARRDLDNLDVHRVW